MRQSGLLDGVAGIVFGTLDGCSSHDGITPLDVVREYLESRYAIQAQEQTSDEIFASLRHMDITDANRNILRQLLVLADLVKFAKEKPLPHENEQSLDNAVAFVNNTKQVIQTPVIKEEDKK